MIGEHLIPRGLVPRIEHDEHVEPIARAAELPGVGICIAEEAPAPDDRGELLVHIQMGDAGEMQPVAGDAMIAGDAPGDKLDAPSAERMSPLIAGAAPPTRRRALYLLIY